MLKKISLLLLLPLLTIVSCKDDDDDDRGTMIWDIYPVNIDIIIQNAEGENILTPDVPGSLFGQEISIEYNGETYVANWSDKPESRAYLAVFKGLRFVKGYSPKDYGIVEDPTRNMLRFGEFDGAENQDLSVVLKIKGQTEIYNINVVHSIKWEKDKPEIDNKMYLNGQLVEGRTIIIRLPASK